MARRADFRFENREPEQANFRFEKDEPIKAIFKIAPPTVNYELLINKPKINHIELIGDKSLEELGIVAQIDTQISAHNLDHDSHPYILSLISAEEQARIDADNILQANIDAEARTREEQDLFIREALADEARIRTEQDERLQTNIEQEAQERQSADQALDQKILQETQARREADQTLQTNINNEARDRQIADNNLHGEVVAESLLRENADTLLGNRINSIDALIPAEATSNNQLADKDYVLDLIKVNGASYRGSWATWAAVPSDPSLYPEDAQGDRTPNANDYMIVTADETQDGGTWMYKYTGTWATDGKNGWLVEYEIEKTPFTPEQQAAIDSGITSALVGQITTNENDISDINTTLSGYGNIVTHNVAEFATASQGALADTAVQPEDLGDGTITFMQGDEEKGSITVNQKGNTTIYLDKGGDSLFNVDGGKANSVYLIDIQKIDGGNAEG